MFDFLKLFGWSSAKSSEKGSSEPRHSVWINYGKCPPKEQFQSTTWNGIAIYDDAIALKGGDTLVIIDKDGISTTGNVKAFI